MKNKLFIAGCARSGTSALAQLIGSHGKVVMGMERFGHLYNKKDFEVTEKLFEVERFLNIQKTDTFYSDFDEFHAWDPNIISKLNSKNYDYIGDKRPEIYKVYDELLRSFPDAKIVFIYRDIYEVASSWSKRAADGVGWPAHRDFKAAVYSWGESLKLTVEAMERYPENIACVKYEDIFINSIRLDPLYKWLNLDIDDFTKIKLESLLTRSEDLQKRRSVLQASKEIKEFCDKNAPFRFEKALDKMNLLDVKNTYNTSDTVSYKDRVNQQINQYSNVSNMHGQLSSILDYWKKTYMAPQFIETCGVKNHIEFYAKPFVDRINITGVKNIVSFGCGDGALEVQVARKMKQLGCDDFMFNLVELSPFQIDRANNNIISADLSSNFNIIEADFNNWTANKTYAGAMAHHALHHVVELEHLFEAIKDGLHEKGVFVSFDMIGRNGHQRWPEVLELVERIWKTLPSEKKYHHILKKNFDYFHNHDCSNQGFEGIRSQDILPLLVKYFNFETFFAYGNLTDEFINRGYGPNYDPADIKDVAFIDFLEYLNTILIDLGHIKPTKMAAVMTLEATKDTKYFRNWAPEFCIRTISKDSKRGMR